MIAVKVYWPEEGEQKSWCGNVPRVPIVSDLIFVEESRTWLRVCSVLLNHPSDGAVVYGYRAATEDDEKAVLEMQFCVKVLHDQAR